MESIWSGIEDMFGVSWLQYLVLLLLTIDLFVLYFSLLIKKKKVTYLVFGIIACIFTIALFYMFYLGIGSLRYIARNFFEYSLMLAGACFVLYMLLFFPKTKLWHKRSFRLILASSLSFILVVIGFFISFVMIDKLPVVYAVEDTYQIVWTTTIPATGSVKVGYTTYYDLYSGSIDSETKVHKVVVPMSVLDLEKEYEITSTNYIYRGPYSGLAGRTVSKTFDFRPVDLTDGLQFYTISDTHEYAYAASHTGLYFGNDLDFLVLDGDISSFLDEISDIGIINKIAYNITKGERPVVYARGNHETKGLVANELYKYVGSKNQQFYYTFNLSGVFGIVLDLGEDHPDDWWEYYGTAHFTEYRQEQTNFINEVLTSEAFLDDDVIFRLGVCHMPITNIYNDSSAYDEDNLFLDEIKTEWTSLLNLMSLDLMVSGHRHQLLQFLEDMMSLETLYYHDNYSLSSSPMGIISSANFPTFLVSRRSDVQTPSVGENQFGRKIIGLATSVDFDQKVMTLVYTNTNLEVIDIIRPFTGESLTEFTIPL